MRKPRDISEARNPDLRASLAAMHRAAALARNTAMQTGTDLIVVRDGRIVRISAKTLRAQARVHQTAAK